MAANLDPDDPPPTDYILQLCRTDHGQAVALTSSGTLVVHDLTTSQPLLTCALDHTVKRIARCPQCPSVLAAVSKRRVSLFDLRCNELAYDFPMPSKKIALTCVDTFDTLLVAGTETTDFPIVEMRKSDKDLPSSHILFIDCRQLGVLGSYCESHSEEVTHVRLCSARGLVSGSTDGLVNGFDIAQTNEDNALQWTYNHEHQVSSLNQVQGDMIASASYGGIALTRISTGDDVRVLRNCGMESVEWFADIVECFADATGRCYALLDSNKICSLETGAHLKLEGNSSVPIRCMDYTPWDDLLLTGGEDGSLNIHRNCFNSQNFDCCH